MNAPDTTPNEPEKDAGKPARPRRQRKPRKDSPPGEKPQEGKEEPGLRGRVLGEKDIKTVEWFLYPYIPRGMLTLVAGAPAVGKSSFLAFLVHRARRTLIFPGGEEEVEVMTVPRLVKNGVGMDRVRFMDDEDYTFPADAETVIDAVRAFRADLIVLDPLSSYMNPGMKTGAEEDVRPFLESLHNIAKESRAAVVGVRHPGKDPTNILAGSKDWRAVPRSIVTLRSDGGTPEKFLISLWKDSLGTRAKPRHYALEGQPGEPPRFKLAAEMDASASALANAAEDPIEQQHILDACIMYKHLFDSNAKPTVKQLVDAMREWDIDRGAKNKAKKILGIKHRPDGKGKPWVLKRTSKEWPQWLLGASK